jgi:two-component system sensor histidine kinase KdpD
MDLDAVLARKPKVALVDELAHTNVPAAGTRSATRTCLTSSATGIDVMTAVNIQHLETLNDVVSRITGVPVREPCRIRSSIGPMKSSTSISRSTSCATGSSRARSTARRRVEQALANFFRKGNLSTLRELALRAVADEVGEKAATDRARDGLDAAVIPERVMVAMSAAAAAPRVIRTGARIAGRLGARWYAVYVETPRERAGRISVEVQDALERNTLLAEALGATIVRVRAERPEDGLIEFARREGITHVIFGPDAAIAAGAAPQRLGRRSISAGSADAAVQVVPGGRDGY